MQDNSIADRYAKAMLNLAISKKMTPQFMHDLEEVVGLIDKTKAFKQLLNSPQHTVDKKKQVIHKCLDGHFPAAIIQLMIVLLNKNRITYFPAIVHSFQRLVRKTNGILQTRLITAVPPEAATIEKLQNNLQNVFGMKITINRELDPKLLGGFILLVGEKMIDASLKTRLAKLKQQLLNARLK